MRHEKLFEPVDGAEPCGPDLDDIEDEDYQNYLMPAEDRLPMKFVEGKFYGGFSKDPIDRSAIDLKSEVAKIGDLLERSRDLRLLTLEARFQIFAGQITGFSESIQAIAGLVSRYWDTVHPLGFDGDFTLRQNTVASLDDRVKVILPLQFSQLYRDKKLGVISYRHYAVASKQVAARSDETALDVDQILASVAADDNRQAVEAVHATLSAARDALNSIRAAFMDTVGYDYAPNFDGLIAAISEINVFIETGRPELSPTPRSAATDEDDEQPATGEAASPGDGAVGAVVAKVPDLPLVAIATQHEAAAALAATEDYFATREPSAPALILIRQARQLIGKPLVVAIDALVPQIADQALMRFDNGLKFQIDMGRMRLLSGEQDEAESDANGLAQANGFSVGSRAEASAMIVGVEYYFRTAEPSSPVPLLLTKARGFMKQDFLAILNDLMAAESPAK